MKIKIVTDSVSDVPADLVEKWDITVVPCFVNFGGESYADDGIELVREEFYEQYKTMTEIPTTAAMPPDFARQYTDPAFEGVDHMIIITTPARLSGIHNSIMQAVSHLPQDRVTVIDSQTLSVGMAWQVLTAAEVAAETGNVAQTLAAIKSVRDNQVVYAAIAELEYLRRSGRVSWAVANVGGLLQIKPVVEVKAGDVHLSSPVRTFKRAINKMADIVEKLAPIDRLAIAHINNPEGAAALTERLADLPVAERLMTNIGPALGVHTGPGTVGFSVVKEGWRDAITT